MLPACSSGTLTNVLPHRNAMPQTQDTTSHPVTVYRHGADLSLCYPLMWDWNTQLPILMSWVYLLGKSFPDLLHTPANDQLYDTDLVVVSRKLGRKYPTNQVLSLGPSLENLIKTVLFELACLKIFEFLIIIIITYSVQ